MTITKCLRDHFRRIKIRMNLGLAKVAKGTHFIPEKPRRIVRDWLIRVTTPKAEKPYREPRRNGRIIQPAGINEFGFFRAQIGLSQGAKLYAKAIKQAGIPCVLLDPDFVEPRTDHSFDAAIKKRGKYAVNLIHINPGQLERTFREYPHWMFDHHYNIGVWLWELETIPEAWKEKLKYVDELWAPSGFIADAVRKATEKPVTLIPYGIETPRDERTRKDFGLSEDAFLVLAMYDSRSYAARKNPDGAIAAFQKAFGKSDGNAMLVLKVSNGKEDEIKKLDAKMKSLGIRYQLITEQFSKPGLNSLIACCDVFISLHRSEGFGLVIAEAMSLGVPVIATGWSANAEFMPDSCTWKVGYQFIPVNNDYQYGSAAHRWADPDISEAADDLREIRENPEKARRMADEAMRYIQREWSIEKSGERIKERYEQICAELRIRGEMPGR